MKNLLVLTFLIAVLTSLAQPPQGYYNSAGGLYGKALQQALHDIIDDHTVISYDGILDAFQNTDKKTNGKVWDMYSDIPGGTPPYEFTFGSDQCGSYNEEGDCYNREHSWPKSWFSDKTPMYSDLFHVYPTDGYVNNKRSNHPYGKVGNTDWISENGSKLGDCITSGYSGTVFEPIDEYKGDLARTYFYMSTRYYGEDNGWAGSGMTNGSQLKSWAMTMMLQWNQLDPVSQKETDRNNAVYSYQHNRNPFIDHPEYADDIWAPNAGLDDQQSATLLTVFPNPVKSTCSIQLPFTWIKHKPLIHVYSSPGISVNVDADISSNSITLLFNEQAPGIYCVNIVNVEEHKVFHCRLIKN